jgi:HEAT repeat protein
MADRLAAKLVKYVEEHTLPPNVWQRMQEELRWTSQSVAQKQARLLKIERFDALQYRHLLEQVKELLSESDEPHAIELVLHYLEFLRLDPGEIRPEEAARLPELMRLMPVARRTFVPAALELLNAALLRPNLPPFLHFQVVNALAALAQSIAVYEDFEHVLAIGACLEGALAADPESHTPCCARALAALLPASTIERLIELYPQRREEPGWQRMAAALLRWSGPVAIERCLQTLEAETNAKNRLALLRLIGGFGATAIEHARQRLCDERWYVVRNAILLLGELHDPELLDQLSAVLVHADPRVQETAVSVLIRNRVEGRAWVFADALTKLHPAVIDQVLDELLYLRDPETAMALESFVCNSQASIEPAKKALRILAALPAPTAAESLRKVLANPTLAAPVRELALSLGVRSNSAQLPDPRSP